MSNIHVLDEETYSKIAAGEVIERPAGVLKELLENSVDAGATAVNIDIEGSGKTLIRINDNGKGMSAEDLELSVLRHSTSKIRHFEDLDRLQTFGFRGEALYSVSAVSRVSISSCEEGGDGNRIEVAAGKVTGKSPAPSIKGTTVEIRDLFYNTPARLKFLKSDSYERACLLKVAEESALANVRVAYRVHVNGREVYNLPAENGELKEAVIRRARHILGEAVADSLIFKEFEPMGLKLFVSPADNLVTVRDFQYVFVNRRPIDSKTVQQALYKAYQNVRGKDRHPAFLVYMSLEPSEFDVNIHPQKRDIRFINESRVFGFLMNSVGETVFGSARPIQMTAQPSASAPGPMPSVSLPPAAQPSAQELFYAASQPLGGVPKENNAFSVKPQTFSVRETEDPVDYVASPAFAPAPVPSASCVSEPPLAAPEGRVSNGGPAWYQGPYHYLGQLQKSYLVFENPYGLVLIDQHAAQERVLFEHYLAAFDNHNLKVQELIFPIHVDLPPSNVESLMSWADWLKTAGFEIARFSAHTVLVSTMPYIVRFKEDDMKEFIVSLAQVVGDPSKSTETLKRKMIAMLACKKAIKAHDQISPAEAEGLLENMKKCNDGMHCPHGRPCVAQMSMKDIGKLFGR